MFTNQKWYTTVNTVETLIQELKRLPPEMFVKYDNNFDDLDLVIFNRDSDDEYLSFAEGGEWERILGND